MRQATVGPELALRSGSVVYGVGFGETYGVENPRPHPKNRGPAVVMTIRTVTSMKQRWCGGHFGAIYYSQFVELFLEPNLLRGLRTSVRNYAVLYGVLRTYA